MNGTYFETFMVGGLALMVAAALSIAWLLWRQDDIRREAVGLALEGIGHEFRFNMFQMVREINDVESGMIRLPIDLPTLAHPQLDAVLGELVATDKRALAAIQATYQALEARKRRVRMQLGDGAVDPEELDALKQATVHGISTLYLWEDHEGAPPEKARSTRSWWVRDWMKAHGFTQDLLSGLALRDAVVEDLRDNGMVLTPKPLTLTAHDYYSRHYDRKADPRGVFGKRRLRKKETAAAEAGGDEGFDEAEEYTGADTALAAAPAAAAAVAASSASQEAADEAPYEADIAVKDDRASEVEPAGEADELADENSFSDEAEADPAFADADHAEEGTEEEAEAAEEADEPDVTPEVAAAAAVPSGQPADDPFAVLNSADLSAFEPDPKTGKLSDDVPGEDEEPKPPKPADAAE